MKKIFTILLLIAISGFTYGQELGKTVIGLKGGLNLTNIGGKDTDNSMKTGANLGVYAESHFIEPLNFQLELQFSSQGHAPKTNLDSKLKVNYLNIPLMAKFFPSRNFNVHAGPQIGFLLSGKAEYGDLIYDVKDQFRGLDLGLLLGTGYDFRLIDRDMEVGLRYVLGITNISKDNMLTRYNRVLQVSLAVMLFEVIE